MEAELSEAAERQSVATRATTLAMVVKSVHLKNSEEGKGPYSTKKERVACVPTLTSLWTELVLCGVPSLAAAFTTWPGMEVGAPLLPRHPSLLPSPPRCSRHSRGRLLHGDDSSTSPH
jgi:hypothetical protein